MDKNDKGQWVYRDTGEPILLGNTMWQPMPLSGGGLVPYPSLCSDFAESMPAFATSQACQAWIDEQRTGSQPPRPSPPPCKPTPQNVFVSEASQRVIPVPPPPSSPPKSGTMTRGG